ncbi:MAG: hypothetical protein WD696_20405 [Bryobacteraceae bacterium]
MIADDLQAAEHGNGADNRRALVSAQVMATARAACGSSPSRYAVGARSFDDSNRVTADKEKCAASGVEILSGLSA